MNLEEEKKLYLHLHNTETKEKEKVTPADGEKILMYTCGPTVYNFAHIGNLRTYTFEDLLRRTIKYFGMKIFQVMNLTDVDDKTIKGAIEKNISLHEYTKPYINAFFEDLEALNIQKVESYPAATDYMDEIIKMIKTLMDKGYAYVGKDNSVYFKIENFSSYGRLSHLCMEDLKAGASTRVASDEYEKDCVADFVVWKSYDKERDGKIFWDSPFGKGRPGWHIECSAMANSILGDSIDIHVGGVDNIFPHHENEIAQSEACSGARFVKHWMHAEHLIVNGRKMSKSLGNFFTLRDLIKLGYSGDEVRYLLLTTHYRTQLNFTLEGLTAARQSLIRLQDLIERLKGVDSGASASIDDLTTKGRYQFKKALGDDLNISQAMAVVFELVRELNTLCDSGNLGKDGAKAALDLFEEFDQILGFMPFNKEEEIPEEIKGYLVKREEARKAKDWANADHYRDLIKENGYTIEDTKSGPKLKLR
ncbi:MAG: Cysteine--tRNA ligase [Chlamydiia bacterium]|nr:Cysteine--tRNA ligase [Chlamydiia bacterium]